LVFVDEFALNPALTRTHARAPRGERATLTEPSEYGASIAVLSALALRGVLAPMTIAGAVNTEVFDRKDIRGWFRHCGYTYSLK
jgi:hypothetical protein